MTNTMRYVRWWIRDNLRFYLIVLALIASFVVFILFVFGEFSGASQRHQEFRDYCHDKGGVVFEKNNNFDCVLNGVKISYYGD